MNDSVFIRLTSALGSLAAYTLAARQGKRKWYPYVILGGVAGAIIGDVLVQASEKEERAAIARNSCPASFDNTYCNQP